MKTAFILILGIAALVVNTYQATAADEPIDSRKLRELHQKVKAGQKLSPEDQAYYDRGLVARRKGEVGKPSGEPGSSPSAATGTGKTSTGMVPLPDLTAEARYKGEDGGLYGAGRNTPPEAHLKAALEIAGKIQPLDASGKPSPDGKIVFLTHGMSNTTNESERFIEVAAGDPRKNPALILIDGAQGGMDSRKWVADTHTRRDTSPWVTLDKRVKAAGVTPQQVQVIWMKHALARVAQYGEFPRHTKQLRDDTETIIHLLKDRFPNLKLVYLSSRSYAGYASSELNPEPFAYESAFAVRSLIQDQIKGGGALSYADGKAPLLLWGPYLWADGEKGRKAGDLVYRREDFREDGTHPSDSGRQKVAEQLLRFFTTDPTAAAWFMNH
ncbi:MAG TPA: hypothetical protein VGH65_05675 [Verrucomicrobiaceae bacterium]|jgi:hypothetical protein